MAGTIVALRRLANSRKLIRDLYFRKPAHQFSQHHDGALADDDTTLC